jgi:hypothetical protein
MLAGMRWFAPIFGLLGAAVAETPPPAEAPVPVPPAAEVSADPASSASPDPTPDPELVAWYQDMRLACADRRATIVARAQVQRRQDPQIFLGETTWAAAAQAGAVSWGAAADPRVNDKTLARTPEPADFRRRDTPAPAPQAAPEPELPAEVLGRLRAIELCQGQTDVAWRAWQAQPLPPERQALIEALAALQGLCTGAEPRP